MSDVLSAAQIAGYAYRAGFRGQALTVATAVALAESGGRPRAHNPVPPDNSYGLWQINMLGALGPERRRAFHLGGNNQLFDPMANARAAFAISRQGRSFGPWTTYTSGAYRRFLGPARQAGRGVTRTGAAPAEGRPTGAAPATGRPAGGTRVPPAGGSRAGRVVLDLTELRRLGRLFQHAADRVEHTRRAVRTLAGDLAPALARLPDPAVAALLSSVLSTLDAPTQLERAAARLDRQGQYADRVRALAEQADSGDAVRFVGRIGPTVDPYERAVLEALLGGRIAARAPSSGGKDSGGLTGGGEG
jgi:hypothetical protein